MGDTLTVNDKKIYSGKRTSFHVYLDSGTTEKHQHVPFYCKLKNLTIYFDSDCNWEIQAEVSIDDKVIARARGKSFKVEHLLEEPIYANSEVKFEISVISGVPSGYQVTIYGDVCCVC
ncbi:MAG: hypothetical protein QGH39_04620 [Candidatus Thermoplasmatota archaeon]|jgi:hypothetical protein|nr:hypothetical protein [Candidatus Thermoplasmatota archaeon]MDP7264828.1 hypothetical protein [Candidatus Thermoplasmatota archaeon]